jgi:hypothetical protein
VADQPTIRTLRFALLEIADLIEYGGRAVSALVTADARAAALPGVAVLVQAMVAAGGLDGLAPQGELPARRHSAVPFRYDGVPRRDTRFPDPYNMGVNAEVFLYDPAMPTDGKVLMMYYKRLREIDVPEMMASIIAETPDKPWGYYRDMTRQLWDEARHAMLGEVGFVAAGVDWPEHVRVNFTWSLGLNTQLTPKERHAVLYFIEQGLMPKTGKRHEWEVAISSRNPLAATIQDFDWADEVLHAPARGCCVRGSLLEQGADGLGTVASVRADGPRELVDRPVQRALRTERDHPGSPGRRLRRELPVRTGGPKGSFGFCVRPGWGGNVPVARIRFNLRLAVHLSADGADGADEGVKDSDSNQSA